MHLYRDGGSNLKLNARASLVKWLYTFAVVTESFRAKALAGCPAADGASIDGSGAPVTRRQDGDFEIVESCIGDVHPMITCLEQVIAAALQSSRAEDVAYYRVIMDGWNRTHLELQPWVEECYPFVKDDWTAFINTGILAVEARTGSPLLRMLPPPATKIITRAAARCTPGDYAASAFLYALFDGLTFVKATGCSLYVLARCVGPSRDDTEYAERTY